MALLLLMGGAVVAQDNPYVIKAKGSNHYLAHEYNESTHKWEVTDATEFSPNCLWYSGIEQNVTGTNHNYYFVDNNNEFHFLSAPMLPNRAPSVSVSLPPTYLLTNTDTIYYFYDWDKDNDPIDGGGVARGHQYYGYDQLECDACLASWGSSDQECWRVYWIAYKTGTGWETTSKSYYDVNDIEPALDGVGGRYRLVTATNYYTPVSGGLTNFKLDDVALSNPAFAMDYDANTQLSAVIGLPYQYKAYTHYAFTEAGTTPFNYYCDVNGTHTAAPTSANGTGTSVTAYEWTLSGPGAAYLSFAPGSNTDTVATASPTLYYRVENIEGDKTATLKLKVTYDNQPAKTQTFEVMVTVKTACQNPAPAAAPHVFFNDVTVSWYNIADAYALYLRESGSGSWHTDTITSATGEIVSRTFTDLKPETDYEYKVQACCSGTWQPEPASAIPFTTGKAPDLMIYGSVFGGGRVANVTGNTTVRVVNCDSIGAVYGGNDIAGTVQGANGATIVLGDATSTRVRIKDVYGGGNGYYAYGSTSFAAATATTNNTVLAGDKVYNMSPTHDSVWINTGSVAVPLPTIAKTSITVANDCVTVDSIFGGAKNAFLTANSGNGSTITVNGGTIDAVFGGNNIGGSQGRGKHRIQVDEAPKDASNNYLTRIQTLFGGGNKVAGSETDILVNGGQIDTLYAGGNSADVYAAHVEVDCSLAKTYSQAIYSYSTGIDSVDAAYPWDGTGIYNVRTLFGGNNQADMDTVPTITLTSGSIGTVYGGGNAGDMVGGLDDPGEIASIFGHLFFEPNTYHPENETIVRKYSTYVELTSNNVLVDYLYGGCQMSNVFYSSWVKMSGGHVGTVYGGCNISGDVGSNYLLPNYDPWLEEEGVHFAYKLGPRHEKYQAVKGGTFVEVTGGHVYNDLFAGSNGRYHCNNGLVYVPGLNFDDLDSEGRYIGLKVPSHNETHVYVGGTAEVGGSVYAGGNLACVGFINESVPSSEGIYYPVFVGMASVRMDGGHVHGNVFGGGNMASIWGSNSVMVEGGAIDGALYGGNDRTGLVAQITNRVLPSTYGMASDDYTSLANVRTYLSITGRPQVGTVYGGGNGDYDDYETGEYCNSNDKPVQSNTFVDINIDGYADNVNGIPAGHIQTVYGGGNGVTVTGSTTVFMNVKNPDGSNHVDTIFGGNNKGPLAILPEVILLKGRVNTIYGGCNEGAMIGSTSVTIGGATYNNLGSMVRLRSSYKASVTAPTVTPSAVVTGNVYGGCRMNGVTNNTLVIVEGGNHPASFFGGSDISGNVGGTSHVVVTGGQTGNLYGGGNGNYDYTYGPYATLSAPQCSTSLVDILQGQVGAEGNNNARNIFGGGYGHLTKTTGNVTVTIGDASAANAAATPTIYGDIYGGSALGNVNTSINDTTTVNFLNGTIHGNVYGGGLGDAETNAYGYLTGMGEPIEAFVKGTVQVNIGSPEADASHQDISKYVTIDGKVFGGNNLAGTPQGNIYVDVYRTAHTTGENNNAYPASFPNPLPNSYFDVNTRYALSEVYGGGNLASYRPLASTDTTTYVHIHNCDNTIKTVYGGGNAANVPSTKVVIDGGLVGNVFGGGNGLGEEHGNPGANVLANDIIELNGGVMGFVYGGSNAKGTVFGETSLLFSDSPNCGVRSVNELYGGGNQAADENGITLNVPCGSSGIKVIYGGANRADVGTSSNPANIVLNVKGGDNISEVYGGNNQDGTIWGNVTLNLLGGTIDKAFGGNNAGGLVKGTIQVNVVDTASCALHVNTVYGGGNMAAYTPSDTTISSPQVNVIHGTVNDAVYGGGLGSGATVTANPVVTIGDDNDSHKAIVGANLIGTTTPGSGNVYGGGDAAAVNGSTTVIYQDTHDNSQVSRLFGGGNQANTNGATINMNDGKVLTGIYGGCNTNGTVVGDIEVNVNGGTLGVEGTPMTSGIFGGGWGDLTQTNGNVTVNIGDGTNAPTIYADVYGGSALGDVHTPSTSTDHTTVNFAKGTLHGDLYGGGLGQASPPIAAGVNGDVIVNIGKDKNGTTVSGGTIVGSVFGANNINGAPLGTVTVNVYNDTVTNVFGGGNQADYTAPGVTPGNYPEVNISGGQIISKVVGGGNEAGINGNPHINISGGTLCTALTDAGIYGGCNTSGIVDGSVTVNITGTDGNTVIGTDAALENETPANVHGGGYGPSTGITGDVTVNYGDNSNTYNEYPKLYGDLYGGSALGSVNGTVANSSKSTTVNVLNGSFGNKEKTIGGYPVQFGGNIYGGGLGDETGNNPAEVYGVVHVNVGAAPVAPATTPTGQANLVHCNVYGGNNSYGSPQEDVYVDVYQTAHLSPYNVYSYTQATALDPPETYAIASVFGGGNRADYDPADDSKTPHTNVHYCENTIEYVYGGGNAAAVNVTNVRVDGGRFKFIFGGGNGQVSAADVVSHVYLTILGGRVGWAFGGCNMHGQVANGAQNAITTLYGCDHTIPGNCPCEDQTLVVENFYFGANMATIYGGLTGSEQIINCGDNFTFKKVFAGSRLATIYGDIELDVYGGQVGNLFGGCEGSQYINADVKKYPTDWRTNPDAYDPELITYLTGIYDNGNGPDLGGTGGNITLRLYGGKIGNVFGGCDYNGNVEGVITIIIDSTQTEPDCRLDIDYVFGGNNLAEYKPLDSLNLDSPLIQIINGHVNGAVYGGGKGGDPTHLFGNGRTVSNPRVEIGDDNPLHQVRIGGMLHSTPTPTQGDGDVFGGGNAGVVKGNTDVILQGHTTIEGNVFGGGKQADVEGNTHVTIVPNNP